MSHPDDAGRGSSAHQKIKVKSNQLVDKVREIIEEGNARRIIIRNKGRTVMEFPLSVGVGGATAAIMLSPTLAAVGAFAALASEVEIVIIRPRKAEENASDPENPSGAAPG